MGILNRVMRRLGYEIRAYPRPDFVLRELFRKCQFGTALDVGANLGQTRQRFRQNGFAGRIISFEPSPEAFAGLSKAAESDPSWTALEMCLGATDGEVELVVGGGDGQASSTLGIREAFREPLAERAPVSRISVAMRSLDSLCEELGIVPSDTFLKMDVQGAELSVLAGAEGMLEDIPAVQAEMAITPIYLGQPTFGDILSYMQGKGFFLHHLYHGWEDPVTGELYETDGIFLNKRVFGSRDSHVDH